MMTRLPETWFCTHHHEIHLGEIESWTMDHRTHLHPVFAEINQEREREEVPMLGGE